MVEGLDLNSEEQFRLPQIAEMVEGVTDTFALFLGDRFRATEREIERIAKSGSTVLARRPVVQRMLKLYAAPVMLGGALGAYFARVLRPTSPANQVHAASHAPPATPTSLRIPPSQPLEPPPPPQEAASRIEPTSPNGKLIADAAQEAIEQVRAVTPPY